jgi:tripartite-type tricarboxylate transporter receptor subunit TctC
VSTLKEFIAYLKARPDQINYGTSGAGGLAHYASEMFNMLAGTSMTHIPYKGGAQMAPDWAANRVQVSLGSTSSSIPFYREKKVKILAVCADEREEGLMEVPTTAEAGLPGMVIGTFHALCAPAATPSAIVEIISQGSREAVSDPDFKAALIRQGVQPMSGLTPPEAAAYVKALSDRVAPIIKAVSGATR